MNIIKSCSIALLILVTGCSSVKNKAIDASAKVLSEASYELETENNWDNFRQAVIPNLKMVEGLLYVRKNNESLLATLAKGYGAYGFVVNETLYLEDKINDIEPSRHLEQALLNYKKSVQYGVQYLEQKGISYNDLLVGVSSKEKLSELLESKVGNDPQAYETVFFMALSSMNMANLNKRNMKLVSQLPLFSNMIDLACDVNPSIAGDNCDVIKSVYLASRPRMMGGNPRQAGKDLNKYISNHPENYFAREAYVQYVVIPQINEKEYKIQKQFFLKAIAQNKKNKNWSPLDDKNNIEENKNMRIYRALAIKRFELIMKYEKELF